MRSWAVFAMVGTVTWAGAVQSAVPVVELDSPHPAGHMSRAQAAVATQPDSDLRPLYAASSPSAVAFMTSVHRHIHRRWGFGVLREWDNRPASDLLNNLALSTTLEIVLDADGTVDKVAIVRKSTYLPYDVAAIAAVFLAAPYPNSPDEVRSENGKVYLHWNLYRDGRQCHPSGAQYFIRHASPLNGQPRDGGIDPPDSASD